MRQLATQKAGRKEGREEGHLNGRMMTSGLEIDATTTENRVTAGRRRSRVRLLMEKGNLISQSQRTQSRARLDFGSYPLVLGSVRRTERSARNGMDCRHETVRTHLVRELREVGEGQVEDGVLAADEDGSRVRVQQLEEVGR